MGGRSRSLAAARARRIGTDRRTEIMDNNRKRKPDYSEIRRKVQTARDEYIAEALARKISQSR